MPPVKNIVVQLFVLLRALFSEMYTEWILNEINFQATVTLELRFPSKQPKDEAAAVSHTPQLTAAI